MNEKKYNRPNQEKYRKSHSLFNPYKLGNNQIHKRFRYALEVLLANEYYEGTEYGKIYNETGENGKSKIYVSQENLENKIDKDFIKINKDITKYLVGYTGVGKTTLIRNIFQVFDRKVKKLDDNLILYLSFYSMMTATKGDRQIEEIVIEEIEMAITYLSGGSYIERLKRCNDEYYKEFYEYIESNNPNMIHQFPNNPSSTENLTENNIRKQILDSIKMANPLDYTLSQLKFSLYKNKENHGIKFENVIFIFDDIETRNIECQEELIELAWHIKKCLQTFKHRDFYLKILISLRNYSFRIHKLRAKEAFREIERDDIILKDSIPRLSEVLEVRFNYVLSHKEIEEKIQKPNSWEKSVSNLQLILKKMYGQYDNMILDLTHNNLFKSMQLLMRILTNKKYFGKYELYNDGSFKIVAKRYNFRNNYLDKNFPRNDDVFYSLVYGEDDVYHDDNDYYLTNIMHYIKRENRETELMGIYIIQFLINKGLCMAESTYDGFDTEEGDEIVKQILNIFEGNTDEQRSIMKKGLTTMMKLLYEGGVLLQSIIEPVREDGDSFKRKYSGNIKVYLSRRGYRLYSLLQANSLLTETYRDDIDTDIEGNNVLTMHMTKYDRIKYCLKYCSNLFCKEVIYISRIKSKKDYIDYFGEKIAVVVIMLGIRESIDVYFLKETNSKKDLKECYNMLAAEINDFLEQENNKENINFKLLDLLK